MYIYKYIPTYLFIKKCKLSNELISQRKLVKNKNLFHKSMC